MAARYPDTRAPISTDSTAAKRPTYSSWSAIILLTGLATVTFGGGGAAACGCDWPCPHAASAGRMATIAAMLVFLILTLIDVEPGKACRSRGEAVILVSKQA